MAKPRPKQPKVGIESVQGNNTTPILFGVGGVILVLAVIAIIIANVSNNKDSTDDAKQFQPVTVAGDPLPAEYSDAQSKNLNVATGAQAPELRGFDFYGTPVDIKADGKAKVVVFFAHWCPHCQAEVPLLSDWLRDNMKKYPTVEFYGVATGSSATQSNYPPSAWLKKEKWPTPIMADNNKSEAASSFGLGAYPYIVALDVDNKVITRTSGEIAVSQFENDIVKAAQAGKPTTPATAPAGTETQVTTTTAAP